jgi:hypothetical protein
MVVEHVKEDADEAAGEDSDDDGEEDNAADLAEAPEGAPPHPNRVYAVLGVVRLTEDDGDPDDYLRKGYTRLWVLWGDGTVLTEDPMRDVRGLDRPRAEAACKEKKLSVPRLRDLVQGLEVFRASTEEEKEVVEGRIWDYWNRLTDEQRREVRRRTDACRPETDGDEMSDFEDSDAEAEEEVFAVGDKRKGQAGDGPGIKRPRR